MEYKIVDYKKEYTPALSDIITRNLTEINSKDYSHEIMKNLALDFTPEKIDEFSNNRKVFVALDNNTPVGIACAAKDIYGNDNDYVILTVFILPELHDKGIGANLISKCEQYVKNVSGLKITIPASITAHEFYKKLGYDYLDPNKNPNADGCILMTKLI